MSENKSMTLGQALDQILAALEAFDQKGRKTILTTVCDHFGISVGGLGESLKPQESAQPAASQPNMARISAIDIRTLKEQKKPKTSQQMACIVAYYLSEHAPEGERRDVVKTEDLEKYFKQAGFKLPKQISQILRDGKASGYFDLVRKGEYTLTPVGYNLVAHSLPGEV